MCKLAVISSVAASRQVESARRFGSWRPPMFGSSGANITNGLIHCGQRRDLEFVFVAMFVMSAFVVRVSVGAHLPSSLLHAVVGINVEVVAYVGICFASVA